MTILMDKKVLLRDHKRRTVHVIVNAKPCPIRGEGTPNSVMVLSIGEGGTPSPVWGSPPGPVQLHPLATGFTEGTWLQT